MKKRRWANRLLLLLAVFIGLFFAEIIARHLPRDRFPEAYSRRYPVYRSELGVITNSPHSCQVVSNPWVQNRICYNKFGFRGPDWRVEKKIRIALLGDSYLEGTQVQYDDLLSTQLEEQLGPSYDVLNFGLSGTGQSEQLRIYRNLVRRFNPQVVIAFITPSNDFEDNIKNLSNTPNKVFLSIRDGRLVEIGLPKWIPFFLSPRMAWVTSFFGNLSSYRMARQLITLSYVSQSSFSPPNAWARVEDPTLIPLKGFGSTKYDEAREVMKLALLSLKEECEEDGAIFLLASVSGCWTYLAEENKWFAPKADLLNLRYKWIEAFATRHHINYLDLNRAILQEYHSKKLTSARIHIPWDGHWTPCGHRLAAAATCNFLKEAMNASRYPIPSFAVGE